MVTISIQAGGRSKRMGENKALLIFHGMPLIQWVVNRVRPIADEINIISGQPDLYQFLDLPIFPDKVKGVGVLGGIYASFCVTESDFVVPIGCDMPFVSLKLLEAELEIMETSKVDVVIPESINGLETLHAVYRRKTCLLPVERAIQSGERRIISWFNMVFVKTITPSEVCQIDPSQHIYMNLNTPEELSKAVEIADRGSY